MSEASLLAGPTNARGAQQPRSDNLRIFHALLSLSSAALLVRVFGMLNQVVVTSRFGAGPTMDAYFVAAALPLLVGQLIVGAIEAAVIPVYARVRASGTREQATVLFNTLLNLSLLTAVGLMVLSLALRQQVIFLSAPALDLSRMGVAIQLAPFVFPMLLLTVALGFLDAILNVEGQFGWPAYAGLLVPLSTALLVLLAGRSHGVFTLAVGALLGSCLQLVVLAVRMRRARLVYRPVLDLRHPALGPTLAAAWPVLLGAFVGQASPLVDQIFASFLTAGSISALSYAQKLVSVPVGVIFGSVGRAALPYLSHQAAGQDMPAFKGTLRLYLWGVGIGTAVLAAAMFVFAHPIVRILFQRGAFSAADTAHTAVTLQGFALGLAPMALGFVISRAFSALGKNRILMYVTAFMVAANALFDYVFARLWQSFGIALATSAVYVCTAIILVLVLRRMIGDLDLLALPAEVDSTLRASQARLREWREVRRGSRSRTAWHQPRMPLQLDRVVALVGILIIALVVGVASPFLDVGSVVRLAIGVPLVLALLRYPFRLLMVWALVDVFIGSAIPLFSGHNLDTGLTIPLLLAVLALPIGQTLRRMPALALLLAYLLWELPGMTLSPLDSVSFFKEWALNLDFVAVGILTIHLVSTRRRLYALVDAILLVSACVAAYGVYGYLTHHNGLVDPQTGTFRIVSIFAYAPPLALFLSLSVPLGIYRALTLTGIKRASALLAVLLCLMAIALTLTRGTLVSVPVSMLIVVPFLASRAARLRLLGGILGSALLAGFLAAIVRVPLFERFFNQDVGTLNGRIYLWRALLEHFDPLRLLGNGLGAADHLLAVLHLGANGQTARDLIATSASNLYVGALFDTGLVGLLLLLAMFAILAGSLIAGMRRAAGERRILLAMALAAVVSVVLQSVEANDFWIQAVGIYFWIIVALPFAQYWSHSDQPEPLARERLVPATMPLP
jgi:putative peptidoglycan lipid II flippase